MVKKSDPDVLKVVRGTGNVFADLGFADAEERQTKLRLAHAINQIIEQKTLDLLIAQAKITDEDPARLIVTPDEAAAEAAAATRTRRK